MYSKAHSTIKSLKARGFEVCKPFTAEDSVFLIRGGWGVSVPKSEKVWRERESPLDCWLWNPNAESEEEVE